MNPPAAARAIASDYSVRDNVTAEEWQVRVDLAACYRLAAHFRWTDLVFTHISARVPGPDVHFLINPYGMYFHEITASSLVKVDLDGNIVMPTDYGINPAGVTIHSAVHAARHDVACVMHLHTKNGCAVAAQKDGLLPLNQKSMMARSMLAYHDYEGLALDLGERERLVRDLGDKSLMILRNHGTLSAGHSVAQAFYLMQMLEAACDIQVGALSAGRDGLYFPAPEAEATVDRQVRENWGNGAKLIWPGLLRILDENYPGYRD